MRTPNRSRTVGLWLSPFGLIMAIGACTPTVRVEAPREPITINLNVQADIRVKIEEQAKQDIRRNGDIF